MWGLRNDDAELIRYHYCESILRLPTDIWARILASLSAKDMCNMSRCCRLLNALASSDSLVWRRKCARDFDEASAAVLLCAERGNLDSELLSLNNGNGAPCWRLLYRRWHVAAKRELEHFERFRLKTSSASKKDLVRLIRSSQDVNDVDCDDVLGDVAAAATVNDVGSHSEWSDDDVVYFSENPTTPSELSDDDAELWDASLAESSSVDKLARDDSKQSDDDDDDDDAKMDDASIVAVAAIVADDDGNAHVDDDRPRNGDDGDNEHDSASASESRSGDDGNESDASNGGESSSNLDDDDDDADDAQPVADLMSSPRPPRMVHPHRRGVEINFVVSDSAPVA
jgi:F-box-like